MKRLMYVGPTPILAFGFLGVFIGVYVFLVNFSAISGVVLLGTGIALCLYTGGVFCYFAYIITGAIDRFMDALNNLTDGDDDNDDDAIRVIEPLTNRRDGLGAMSLKLSAFIRTSIEKRHWYMSILDNIPMSISVTGLDMKWQLVNKSAEKLLKRSRAELLGKTCQNWNSEICGTNNCGIVGLRRGQLQTVIKNQGLSYQVDSAYLYNTGGDKVGHIEIVQNVSSTLSILEYSKEAIELLSGDLDKLAGGSFIDEISALAEGSDYTRQVRADFMAVRENLERLRTAMRSMLFMIVQDSKRVFMASEQLSQASIQAGIATNQISSTIQQVAQGATETSHSVANVAENIQGMNIVINAIADGIEKQNAAVGQATRVAEKMVGDGGISNKVKDAAQKVSGLVAHAERINKVLETISEFASQTNMLSINAAIEAAHVETQGTTLSEVTLNRQMTIQARLINQMLLNFKGRDLPPAFWVNLAKQTGIDTICITDQEGVTVYSNESVLLGWKFPDDPTAQAYEFRKLIGQNDGVVCQATQKRSIDQRNFKFVGVSRTDVPGIVQVAFDSDTLAAYQVRMGGFAVIADEVRRLANKSGEATKEIANTIQDMGNYIRSSVALTEAVAQELQIVSGELSQVIHTVSSVVAENQEATAELMSRSSQMGGMAENIAVVSEQNSAASEEVSASTEQMTASVEQMSSSAQSLQEMAHELQESLTKFQL